MREQTEGSDWWPPVYALRGTERTRRILVTADAAVQTFVGCTRKVHRRPSGTGNELSDMVKLLSDALRRTYHGSRRTVFMLEEIEKQLLAATQLEDIRALRSKLELCLASVRTEAGRQVAEHEATRATLETVIAHRNSGPVSEEYRIGSLTGLPGRLESRASLERARSSDSACYAVVLSLDRMTAVENRFGARASEMYLMMASQCITQKLGERDELFEWRRQAFLAIVESSGSGNSVSEAASLSGPHRPCTIEVGARTVLIPISITSLCLRVSESPDTDALIERIDLFVSKATTQGDAALHSSVGK